MKKKVKDFCGSCGQDVTLNQTPKKEKEIKFTLQEIQELNWIVYMYKDTHKGHYEKGEPRVLNNIIKKLINMELKIVLEEKK